MRSQSRLVVVAGFIFLARCSTSDDVSGRYCPPETPDRCIEADGNTVLPDGRPYCELNNTCGDGGGPGDSAGGGDSGGGDQVAPDAQCTCVGNAGDLDQDCIADNLETTNSNPGNPDSDNDGIRDGCEDRNHDGTRNANETDPKNADSDNDGIPDGVEDSNHNGRLDPGETNPRRSDSDLDGIADGVEDANHNGVVDPWVDINGNNCFDAGVDTAGEGDPANLDTDGDGIRDDVEDADHDGVCDAGETCFWNNDTDCDGLRDGKEDLNHNGQINTNETDPLVADTDGDGIRDGAEDTDGDGNWDVGLETDPRRSDSDGDGIADGVEDTNKNGVVDAFTDINGNGCWDAGEPAGEGDPRKFDSDGDGIVDGIEDRDKNGQCGVADLPDPLNPSQIIRTFLESCNFLADTDCDGLSDGNEDVNHNGSREIGETDALKRDTDADGLIDGCPPSVNTTQCEDKNNDGITQVNETSPLVADSDGDALPDGCEVNFDPTNCSTSPNCGTDPLNEDTDLDGFSDGEEDVDHDCVFDAGETDPRVFTPPPPTGTEERAEWNVCGTQNLKQLTFAVSSRVTHDYRLAFEVEKDSAGGALNYIAQPYGKDLGSNGFNAADPADALWGHVFQSPGGVSDPASPSPLSRDVYGALFVSKDNRALDAILDALRTALETAYPATSGNVLTELPGVTARPAHDDLPAFRVNRAQRQFRLSIPSAATSLAVRNNVLVNVVLGGQTPDPANVPPTQDPVYGPISCAGAGARCYRNFSLSIAAVQRPDRKLLDESGLLVVDNSPAPPVGDPEVVTIIALTPDDSAAGVNEARLYADRLVRLEDLTGGSALARFDAETSKTCEKLPFKKAVADVLWVTDDSRSMQQVIGRVRQAAFDAKDIFNANANIVDFRLAMTTTNPSVGSRTQCFSQCDNDCLVGNSPTTTCNNSCADVALGCLKVCPAGCYSSCAGGICTCNASCAATPRCENGTPCIDPTSDAGIAAAIAADVDTLDEYPMPGGGGTFYYEDSQMLDCDSEKGVGQGQGAFSTPCNVVPFLSEFTPFFNSGARKYLSAHAGFLGADVAASCSLAPMDLYYKTDLGSTCVTGLEPTCCPRLTAECTDGPTVLASQMCDLIRSMGGLPEILSSTNITSGARPHSAPEMGTRSARRLVSKLLPAYPRNHGTSAERKVHLRINCTEGGSGKLCPGGLHTECDLHEECVAGSCVPTGNCETCNPGDVNLSTSHTCPGGLDSECKPGEHCVGTSCVYDCQTVPFVTVFLSDEEDYWFKDECAYDPTGTFLGNQTYNLVDHRQLPELCRNVDGNPATFEECTETYCSAQGFSTGAPSGYNPDAAARNETAGFTLKWRAQSATECSAAPVDATDTCLGDPCVAYDQTCTDVAHNTQGPCEADADCNWNATTSKCVPDCAAISPLCENNPNATVPNSVQCLNHCAVYTAGSATTSQQRDQQKTNCLADSQCQWDQSQVTFTDQVDACTMAAPINDCQPCKRLRRHLEALNGEATPTPLPGFADLGPVYAIVRNNGIPGFGGINISPQSPASQQDECKGGQLTWGRGDGSAYRDLAIATLGRTQNVCTSDYRDFMETFIADLATLSAPYRLSRSPISATIKVGLARPDGSGGFTFIDVPRSRTQGFIYDPTNNSIGFKSDPVDINNDNQIDASEVSAARDAAHVPRSNDSIYVSYRYWLPVPCRDQCQDGEACVRVICQEEGTPPACPGGNDTECPPGYICQANVCQLDCTPNEFIDVCVPNPQCPECEVYNSNLQVCQPAPPDANGCACAPAGTPTCVPDAPQSCPAGLTCDESCVCVQAPGCANGFDPTGVVSSCTEALSCCQGLDANAVSCSQQGTPGACDAVTSCSWSSVNTPCCEWNVNIGRCDPFYQPCCLPGEESQCLTDAETGDKFLFCSQTQSCECTGTPCSNDTDCPGYSASNPPNLNQTCDLGTGFCTPSCIPQFEYCCVECGCTCEVNPQ